MGPPRGSHLQSEAVRPFIFLAGDRCAHRAFAQLKSRASPGEVERAPNPSHPFRPGVRSSVLESFLRGAQGTLISLGEGTMLVNAERADSWTRSMTRLVERSLTYGRMTIFPPACSTESASGSMSLT